jgi:hypothetical protein
VQFDPAIVEIFLHCIADYRKAQVAAGNDIPR